MARRTALRLDTLKGRTDLVPRADPYWQRIRRHFFLGLRKTSAERSSIMVWSAKYDGGGKRATETLGDFTESFGFNEALARAEEWLANTQRGVRSIGTDGKRITVESACRSYVKALNVERPRSAVAANGVFERYIYGRDTGRRKVERTAFADFELSKLHAGDIEDWRNDLAKRMTLGAVNRALGDLKAALNHAVRKRIAPAGLAGECKLVEAFRNARGKREVYLKREQRRALIEECTPPERDILEATALTGCRPGTELTRLRRSDFDERSGSMRFGSTAGGKTGSRLVPLSPAAVAFFTRLARDKHPQAWLFTMRNGKPWKQAKWSIQVTAACDRLRARDAHFPANVVAYTLRHCFITDALISGEISILEVARLVGTSVAMIEQHYGHLVPDTVRERLAKVSML